MRHLSPVRAHASLSISTKVLLAFAVVLLTTLALGGFALDRLGQVNAAAADVRNEYLPATRVLGQIGALAFRYRQLEATHLLAATPAGKADEAKTMAEVAAQVTASIAAYGPLPRNPEAIRTAAGFPGAWEAYLTLSRKLLVLSNADQTGEATRLYTGDMRTSFNRFKDQVGAAMDRATRSGTEAADRGEAVFWSARIVTFGAIILAVLLGALAWASLVLGVAGPVRRMTAVMRRLAARELSVDVPDQDRQDEIGRMAQAVGVFKAGLIEADRLADAERHTEDRRRRERGEEMNRLAMRFEGKVGRVVQEVIAAATQLESTAHAMTGMAEQATSRSATVAAGATEASANVQTVAAAAEELSASISEIATQVVRSAATAEAATREAATSRTNVEQLAQFAEKIGEVVTIINAIAGRTNLLALNATIEAARAGEAGKGFAVVASEVKALAGQTARATDEIGMQIAAMQQATGHTVSAIRSIGGTMSVLNEISAAIAASVEEQGAATREIAGSVQHAAQGTEEMSRNIAGVRSAANDTGAAASQVLSAAGTLTRHADDLRSEVEQFLARVREPDAVAA